MKIVDLPKPTADIADRDDVERMVRAFYRQAAQDGILGPVFEAAEVDWPSHIDTLVAFWSWQLLGEHGYHNQPLLAHRPVHAVTPLGPAHFERWLDLFESTVTSLFVGPVAETAVRRAHKMAVGMQRLLDGDSDPGTAPVIAHQLQTRR